MVLNYLEWDRDIEIVILPEEIKGRVIVGGQ